MQAFTILPGNPTIQSAMLGSKRRGADVIAREADGIYTLSVLRMKNQWVRSDRMLPSVHLPVMAQ
jgi:hypothetical protein